MLGLLGLWLLYWSLIKDRAKGRRRCPKCWYDMSATEGLRCSECGYAAKREKKLFKTHRRWRWMLVAIVLLVAGHVTHTAPRIQKAGWIGTIPTTILITVFPWQHKMRWITTLAYQPGWAEAIYQELERRINSNETWQWQRHKLAKMSADLLIFVIWQGLDSQSHSEINYIYYAIGEDASHVYPQLLEILESKDSALVREAGYLLSFHPTDDPIIHNKIAALLQHEDEAVRERAPYYLVSCAANNNRDFVIPKLIEAMNDPNPEVCATAINAAFVFEPVAYELIPTIEEFLDNENAQVRFQAKFVLDFMKAKKKKSQQKNPASSK